MPDLELYATPTAALAGPDRDETADLYRSMLLSMLRIRRFDEAAAGLVHAGQILGGVHLTIGQEATVVGTCQALRRDDLMAGHHRSHGHPIAKGSALGPLMAELLGKATGVCGGKGGSMHLADFSVGSLGESGIVGSSIPVAVGAGLGVKLRGEDRVAVSFFGDGAVHEGAFHEAVNLAATWQLPVVFVCENNLYAFTVPLSRMTHQPDIAARAAGYGIPGVAVDGQDAVAVYREVSAAVALARAGGGPTLVEAKTYRYDEHAVGIDVGVEMAFAYRSQEEIQSWRDRDPIVILTERAIVEGALSREEVGELDAQAQAETAEAVAFAQASPEPDLATQLTGIFTNKALPEWRESTADARPPRRLSFLTAVGEAEKEEMRRDPSVFLMGEDLRSNIFGSAGGLLEEFGPERVRDTPMSEAAMVGAGVGSAMVGLRPVMDLTCSAFAYCAMDQIVSQAAKSRYMFGAQTTIPLVIRLLMFYNRGIAAHHSDRPYPMLMNVPGLKIIAPSNPYDMKGMLKAAIRDDDPVLCFEDATLWARSLAQLVPDDPDFLVPLGKAEVKRAGTDVTVVAISGAVRFAVRAADALAKEGISAEVLDPRTLVPMDWPAIFASVAKTGRLVAVDPANRTCSAASEIIASATEEVGPIRARRVATPDVPIPYSPVLEKGLYPSVERITAAIREVLL